MNPWTAFLSMISEDGQVSHKRWISVSIAAAILFINIWTAIKYANLILSLLYADMGFVLIMSGMATLPQILSVIKGAPSPTDTPNQTPTQP